MPGRCRAHESFGMVKRITAGVRVVPAPLVACSQERPHATSGATLCVRVRHAPVCVCDRRVRRERLTAVYRLTATRRRRATRSDFTRPAAAAAARSKDTRTRTHARTHARTHTVFVCLSLCTLFASPPAPRSPPAQSVSLSPPPWIDCASHDTRTHIKCSNRRRLPPPCVQPLLM